MTLEATMRLEIDHLQSQLAKARGEVRRFKDHAQRESAGLGKAMFGGIGGAVSGLVPAMGLGALAAGAKNFIGHMDDVADAALRLNESTEAIQRVEYASKLLASLDINQVASHFEKLERALGDVENVRAAESMARLGLSAGQLSRMSLEEKMLALADAYQTARGSGTRFNDALNLMGKSVGQLLPMLAQGSEGIRGLLEAADKDVVVPGVAVQRMAELNDKADSFMMRLTAGGGAIIGMLGSIGEMIGGASFEDAFANNDGGLEESQRQAARDKQAAEREAMAEAAAAEESAKAQLKIDEERAKQQERVKELQEQARKARIDSLPPEERLVELLNLQDEKLQDMHMNGGQFFAATVDGLQQLADAQQKAGRFDLAAKTLESLKDVISLQKEAEQLQSQMRQSDAQAAKELADQARDRAQRLNSAKQQTADAGMEDPERLNAARARLQEINREIEAGREAGRDTLELELQREEVQQRILGLTKSLNQEAEQLRKEQADQARNLADYKAELEILREQAAGHDKKVQALKEEREIQQEIRRIKEQTGVEDAEARKMAEETMALKKRIAEDRDGSGRTTGGRRRIDASIEGGGADAARERAQKRIDDARARVNGGFASNLDEFKNNQKTRLRDTFKTPGLDAMKDKALGDKAVANKAKEDGSKNPNASLEDRLATIEEVLREGLDVG
jgi:hypothetical protein